LVVGVRRANLARVLREPKCRIRGARDQRIERADQVEHRAVDHRPRCGIRRIELRQTVLVAEVLHDSAALPQRAALLTALLVEPRQVRRVLGEEFGRSLLPPHVDLVELEPRGPYEDPRAQVVDARPEDAERVGGHVVPPYVAACWWYGSCG